MTLMALPKPLSQSPMTGIRTASLMRRTASRVSLMVRTLASGSALAAEMPKPLAQTASKPASSASLADRASWAPRARAGPGRRSSARSCAVTEGVAIVGKTIRSGVRSRKALKGSLTPSCTGRTLSFFLCFVIEQSETGSRRIASLQLFSAECVPWECGRPARRKSA